MGIPLFDLSISIKKRFLKTALNSTNYGGLKNKDFPLYHEIPYYILASPELKSKLGLSDKELAAREISTRLTGNANSRIIQQFNFDIAPDIINELKLYIGAATEITPITEAQVNYTFCLCLLAFINKGYNEVIFKDSVGWQKTMSLPSPNFIRKCLTLHSSQRKYVVENFFNNFSASNSTKNFLSPINTGYLYLLDLLNTNHKRVFSEIRKPLIYEISVKRKKPHLSQQQLNSLSDLVSPCLLYKDNHKLPSVLHPLYMAGSLFFTLPRFYVEFADTYVSIFDTIRVNKQLLLSSINRLSREDLEIFLKEGLFCINFNDAGCHTLAKAYFKLICTEYKEQINPENLKLLSTDTLYDNTYNDYCSNYSKILRIRKGLSAPYVQLSSKPGKKELSRSQKIQEIITVAKKYATICTRHNIPYDKKVLDLLVRGKTTLAEIIKQKRS
jgi:hypothetical protein